jgi:hypothetical protein
VELLKMRAALVCALAACGLTACRYDYDALLGGGGGSGGDIGSGGSGGGEGGIGGEGARPGTGGDWSLGGAGGTGVAGGASGAAGAGARGGTGGTGGSTGDSRGGAGGSGDARGGAGGSGDGRGGASGAGGAGGSGDGRGGAGGRGGASGAAGTGARGGTGGVGGMAGGGGGVAGSAGGRGGAGGSPEVDLVLWYKFDDGSGTVALDSSTASGAPRNGTLVTGGTAGAVAFSTTHQVGTHAVSLTANGTAGGGYVIVPSLHDLAPGALTISAWVYVNTAQRWQRVVDVGNTTTHNIALTTQNGSDAVRFVIRTTAGVTQEIISTVVLSLSAWHHLAVVLPEGSPYTGELYVDGVSVATNAAMTLHAADLGATVNNFLGKSQFADPYFAGLIDDFRVYRRALNREQITALYNAR